MTRMDPSLHRSTDMSWTDSGVGRERSHAGSVSRGVRNPRGVDGEHQVEDFNKKTYRFYERGRPLPSNYVPEPKAAVPYRNVNLGVPSQRRNHETYMQDSWRSESPQRYTYHSNFRQGTDSERNSPTRHSSVSPDRYKLAEYPNQRWSLHSRSQSRSQLSRHTSGRSSPSRGRGSFASRAASPSRMTPSHKRTDSSHLRNGEHNTQKISSRGSRSPSKTSSKHTLDSEKLYRNLESISRRASSAFQQNSNEGSRASPQTRTAVDSSTHTRCFSSREVSPSRRGCGVQNLTPQWEPSSRDSRLSRSPGSWQGSLCSILSFPPSRGSSTPKPDADLQAPEGPPSFGAGRETEKDNDKLIGNRSRSSARRGMEALLISEPKKAAEEVEEAGMTMDDYIMLADIPKIQLESEEEFSGMRRRIQSPSPSRDQRLRTLSHRDETDFDGSMFESEDRSRRRERGRDRREKCRYSENGRSSRRHSAASLHAMCPDTQSSRQHPSKVREQAPPGNPDIQASCRDLKGWMSRLDDHGKWRKHWFVLSDTSLRYYRDSEAEESDDLDGEIDLSSSVTVSDCDVERNYGLQIKTKRAVFTLSATTSRIRRNWVTLLKKAIQNNTVQSDSPGGKKNPLSMRPSPCQPPACFTCKDSGFETTGSNGTAAEPRRADRPQSADGGPDSAPQREEGVGRDREQSKRLEERNKWFEDATPLGEKGSRWDCMELKSGSVPVPVIETMDSEVNRKWTEFERLSFRGMTAQSLIGAQAHQSSMSVASQPLTAVQTHPSSTNISNSEEALPSSEGSQPFQTNTAEPLQKEVSYLRRQADAIEGPRVEMDSPCGPRAPCRAWLEAAELAHRTALRELQERHAVEIRELEQERDRMLWEERETAAKAIEALRTAHREELEREVEKARRLAGSAVHPNISHRGHMPGADVLHGELDVLSERYSQKCLELSSTEQSCKSRETTLRRMERELQQLRRENQELKAKLAEEMSRLRYFITGQRSEMVSHSSSEHLASNLETLLQSKENEVQYLRSEISSLQSEVQALTKEKDAACERYKEIYVELSNMKGWSQLEMGALSEHLRLTEAALQERVRES